MRAALIGHTGFVGQTLAAQRAFSATFNSSNIQTIDGQTFDLAVCAAAPGSMFEANRQPERDRLAIDGLMARLGATRARRFVLISTIAVLERFDGGATEDTAAFQTGLAYGANRRRLEAFCADRFEDCLIVRLPALFGPGLRKNFLFDLQNPAPSMLGAPLYDRLCAVAPPPLRDLYAQNAETGLWVLDRAALNARADRAGFEAILTGAGLSAVRFTHPASRFQFYDMGRLWADIQRATEAGLSVIHLAPEPLQAGVVHQALTGRAMAANEAKLHVEDMRSRHAGLWGQPGPYLWTAEETLAALTRFFRGASA